MRVEVSLKRRKGRESQNFLARVVVIESRKEWYDPRVVKSQAPNMQNRHSSGVARKAFAGLVHKESSQLVSGVIVV